MSKISHNISKDSKIINTIEVEECSNSVHHWFYGLFYSSYKSGTSLMKYLCKWNNVGDQVVLSTYNTKSINETNAYRILIVNPKAILTEESTGFIEDFKNKRSLCNKNSNQTCVQKIISIAEYFSYSTNSNKKPWEPIFHHSNDQFVIIDLQVQKKLSKNLKYELIHKTKFNYCTRSPYPYHSIYFNEFNVDTEDIDINFLQELSYNVISLEKQHIIKHGYVINSDSPLLDFNPNNEYQCDNSNYEKYFQLNNIRHDNFLHNYCLISQDKKNFEKRYIDLNSFKYFSKKENKAYLNEVEPYIIQSRILLYYEGINQYPQSEKKHTSGYNLNYHACQNILRDFRELPLIECFNQNNTICVRSIIAHTTIYDSSIFYGPNSPCQIIDIIESQVTQSLYLWHEENSKQDTSKTYTKKTKVNKVFYQTGFSSLYFKYLIKEESATFTLSKLPVFPQFMSQAYKNMLTNNQKKIVRYSQKKPNIDPNQDISGSICEIYCQDLNTQINQFNHSFIPSKLFLEKIQESLDCFENPEIITEKFNIEFSTEQYSCPKFLNKNTAQENSFKLSGSIIASIVGVAIFLFGILCCLCCFFKKKYTKPDSKVKLQSQINNIHGEELQLMQ